MKKTIVFVEESAMGLQWVENLGVHREFQSLEQFNQRKRGEEILVGLIIKETFSTKIGAIEEKVKVMGNKIVNFQYSEDMRVKVKRAPNLDNIVVFIQVQSFDLEDSIEKYKSKKWFLVSDGQAYCQGKKVLWNNVLDEFYTVQVYEKIGVVLSTKNEVSMTMGPLFAQFDPALNLISEDISKKLPKQKQEVIKGYHYIFVVNVQDKAENTWVTSQIFQNSNTVFLGFGKVTKQYTIKFSVVSFGGMFKGYDGNQLYQEGEEFFLKKDSSIQKIDKMVFYKKAVGKELEFMDDVLSFKESIVRKQPQIEAGSASITAFSEKEKLGMNCLQIPFFFDTFWKLREQEVNLVFQSEKKQGQQFCVGDGECDGGFSITLQRRKDGLFLNKNFDVCKFEQGVISKIDVESFISMLQIPTQEIVMEELIIEEPVQQQQEEEINKENSMRVPLVALAIVAVAVSVYLVGRSM